MSLHQALVVPGPAAALPQLFKFLLEVEEGHRLDHLTGAESPVLVADRAAVEMRAAGADLVLLGAPALAVALVAAEGFGEHDGHGHDDGEALAWRARHGGQCPCGLRPRGRGAPERRRGSARLPGSRREKPILTRQPAVQGLGPLHALSARQARRPQDPAPVAGWALGETKTKRA